MIRQTLQQFTGEIEQVPPAHSACKISGEHAYHRARRGEEVKLQAKKIHIERIELQDVSMPEVTIRVVCSKGTYIRALARDIGEALGCGAYLTALERTRIGEYTIDKCLSIDDVPAWLDTIKTND
jgi:tRNA pseudouridine55 synthase